MKTVVPSLISFETDLKNINGFYLKPFDFFPETDKKFKFHYRVAIDDSFQVPERYDFRHGYYFKKGNVWYYQRKLGGLALKFCFDLQKKTFLFNKNYLFLPIELGNILPVGRHLANLIGLFCFLDQYLIIGGCAFNFKGANYGFISSGSTGKTTFVKEVLDKGASYISEDILCFDYENNYLYPTGCSFFNIGRKINRELRNKLYADEYPVIKEPVYADKIFLVQNSTRETFRPRIKDLLEFSFLNSLFFLSNPFIRAFIFKENLAGEVLDKIQEIRTVKFKKKFRLVFNFDYLKLLK